MNKYLRQHFYWLNNRGENRALDVNCSGKTEARSISNHWRQTCVPLSRKQGSVTPWRNLPVCFIGLICCLTSLSPSDYSCSCLLFRPRSHPITQRLFVYSYPPPFPSLYHLPFPSTRTISNPPRHPSLSLTAHISSCVSAHCEEAHYETFQCWASPVGPFLFDTCAANESFTSLIPFPPFISKGWITAAQWKSRRWINHGYKVSHMATYCTGITGNEKALLRKQTRPQNTRRRIWMYYWNGQNLLVLLKPANQTLMSLRLLLSGAS